MPEEQSGILAQLLLEAVGYLSGDFPGRLISHWGDSLVTEIQDLAILDFSLWGYIKHKIWVFPQLSSKTIQIMLLNRLSV